MVVISTRQQRYRRPQASGLLQDRVLEMERCKASKRCRISSDDSTASRYRPVPRGSYSPRIDRALEGVVELGGRHGVGWNAHAVEQPRGPASVHLASIEALRLQSVTRSYAVACIVSYDARPEQFQPFIDQQVRNRKPVLYCNDGHFGGTRIGTVQDQRMPSWLRDSFPEGLPPGDSVLIVDV